MVASISDIPIELFYAIIAYIEPDDLLSSTISLSRALPRNPVPTYHLYEDIRLKHRRQVIQLYLRLRNAPEYAARVRALSLESWTVDADGFVNLMALLPSVVRLSIFVGPDFAPEHLEEVFQRPKPSLRELSLRFRP